MVSKRNRRLSPGLPLCLALSLWVLWPHAGIGQPPGDRYTTYQLSHIESERALALLKTLGYTVIGLGEGLPDPKTKKPTDPKFPRPLGSDGKPALIGDLPRPIIYGLPESEDISHEDDKALGENLFKKVVTGVAQQRLLIAWRDSAELQKLLNRLHEHIDVAAKQILIDALVIELDRDRFKDLGFSYEASKDGSKVSFQEANDVGLPLLYDYTRPAAKTIFEFAATVKALAESGEAEVLSRPSVLVLDGRQARIYLHDKVPYSRVFPAEKPKGKKKTDELISTTSYFDVGILLNLRPRANEDDTDVTMRVEIRVNSPLGTKKAEKGEVILTESGELVGPPLVKREVDTYVRVANNTPFIIGGLIRSTSDLTKSGVPYLSKIPILGGLFRRTNKSATNKEVIIVLTPQIIPPDDESFTFTIARDSELFDRSGLELFRNVYRVRSDDLFDLGFIEQSEFMESLSRWVLAFAEKTYKELIEDEKKRLPPNQRELVPVAEGARLVLARKLREIVETGPERLRALPNGGILESEAFLQLLEGKIPGEDKFVKRMLLQIVEERGFDRFVKLDQILFYERQPGSLLDASRPVLKTEPLYPRMRDLDPKACRILQLTYPSRATSQGLPFDPPNAQVTTPTVKGEEFLRRLRDLNRPAAGGAGWEDLAILLSEARDCYESRGRSMLEHLRSVLVLKRLLDLNPGLPLTLDGLHVGRDLILPEEADLETRVHVVDREAAMLFYETLDYYFAFEQTIRQVLSTPGVNTIVREGMTADALGSR